jgi:hypothetical protein
MKVSRVVDLVLLQTTSIAVASAGVFLAAVYYIFQIRNQTRMRQTDLVLRLYSQFNGLEFQRLWHEVLNREVADNDDHSIKEGEAEVVAVGMFFEGIGILLKRALIDIDLVDDMFTTPIKWTWEKMRGQVLEARKVRGQPEILEWFEYLYDEMEKRQGKLQNIKY